MNDDGHEALEGRTEEAARQVVDAGLKVHRALGPGLLESAYQQCLAHEFTIRGVSLQKQVSLPIVYDGKLLDAGYRIDLLVEGAIIVAVKSVEALAPMHQAHCSHT
jgi:GxxExxY protein